jgi:acetylornithine deacetylase/succinyl-diaminopimelate desuccinylase-like protein
VIAEAAAKSSDADVKRALGVQNWINNESLIQSMERLASQPTVNIEGLVSGYTGPGGKTILPARAVAKMDLRLVPDMTAREAVDKLRAHLTKRGFPDVEVNMTGGYDPTETAEDAAVIRAQQAVLTRAGVAHSLYPRLAGSWPGYVFTGAPLKIPAGQFGLGHGSGAHAPDEYFVVESTNPKVLGMVEASVAFADFLYEIATIR